MSGVLLWVVIPYVCLAFFVLGHVWRYRYDKFGWTTRSSQLYESRLLRWGSPLFHFGILAVFFGHVMGLGIPESWTSAVGISEELYHVMAVTIGAVAGFCTLVGLTLLIYRRRTVGPVFSATTRMDKVMYLFLALVIVLGVWNTVAGSVLNLNGEYDYRTGVSEWFRGIFLFQPKPELMVDAPFGFQAHAMVAMLLFALWPFTRLVHVLSVPIFYLWRPYVVYRSRSDRSGQPGRRGPAGARRTTGCAASPSAGAGGPSPRPAGARAPRAGPGRAAARRRRARGGRRRRRGAPGWWRTRAGTRRRPATSRRTCASVSADRAVLVMVLIDDGHVLDLLRRPCCSPCCSPPPTRCDDTRWRYPQRARRGRPRTFLDRPEK